jgi:predicted permease
MSTGRSRSRSWWRRRRSDADFNAEIQAHLDLEVDRLTADGVEPDEARHRARRAFGNVLAAEERFYDTSRWIWLDQFRQDLRYAVRSLWRSRSFVSTTVLTLAVGLGLLTALFAVLNTYVLRPLAIHDPYRIYEIRWQSPGDGGFQFGAREYDELRARRDLFDDVVAHRWQLVSSKDRGVNAAFVSGNYFDMLQPRVRLGRPLAAFDTRAPGGAPVAVLSDQGWARLFDRDPQVLGRRLELNGQTFDIVGVMRPEFSGMDDLPLDAWLPLTMYPTVSGQDIYDAAYPPRLTLFGRLRTGVSPGQAGQALTPFMARAAARAQAGRIKAEDVRGELRQRATPNPLTVEVVAMLLPVFAAFGLVLVAACANVSNVMLARAIARHREIGIRLSIGASRGRIVRQLLTEALLISTLAGIAGLGLAAFILRVGVRMFFVTLPASMAELITVMPLEIDYRVFLFALGLAAAATLFFALLPALQATRLTLTDALRGQPAPGIRNGRLRDLLVAGQVTVSLVLLIAAATLARNGVSIAATDLGLETRGVLSVNQRGEGSALIPAAAQALANDPRVSQLAVTSWNPLFGRFPTMAVEPGTADDKIDKTGKTDKADKAGSAGNAGQTMMTTSYVFVSPEYFPVLRIPILRGRTFQPAEAQAEARVGIVSDRAANAFWPGRDPIGRTVRIVPAGDRVDENLAGYAEILIVGVVKDVVSGFVYDGTDTSVIYLPTSRTGTHAGALLARGPDAGSLQRAALQETLARVNRDHQIFEVMPLNDMKEIMLYPLRAASWIGSLLGVVALALSVSGLYGVLMYVLGQRTREIGIRMALGATAAGVVRLVMRQSARVVGIGAAVGLVFAFVTLKLLSAVVTLRNVSLLDAWAFGIGLALIALAAGLAAWFPARRAARVDPCQTLRADA